ncbi:hypothetical protein HAX54_053117, partial [Datura stramonium]|nr:hypothetical protein [Datura stramonium]
MVLKINSQRLEKNRKQQHSVADRRKTNFFQIEQQRNRLSKKKNSRNQSRKSPFSRSVAPSPSRAADLNNLERAAPEKEKIAVAGE